MSIERVKFPSLLHYPENFPFLNTGGVLFYVNFSFSIANFPSILVKFSHLLVEFHSPQDNFLILTTPYGEKNYQRTESFKSLSLTTKASPELALIISQLLFNIPVKLFGMPTAMCIVRHLFKGCAGQYI